MQYDIEGTGGILQTPATATMERALVGDDSAAAEIIRRLAAGDSRLAAAVARPNDPAAERIRFLLVQYLARGTWQGRILPLPSGFHAGREGHHLRNLISHAAVTQPATSWERTLLESLRDPDPVQRQVTAQLLSGNDRHAVLDALVSLLGAREEGVRWAAAMALPRGNQATVEALLYALSSREVVPEMRHVAAYVLRHLGDATLRQHVAPVVQALDASDYRVEVPLVANDALRALAAHRTGM